MTDERRHVQGSVADPRLQLLLPVPSELRGQPCAALEQQVELQEEEERPCVCASLPRGCAREE